MKPEIQFPSPCRNRQNLSSRQRFVLLMAFLLLMSYSYANATHHPMRDDDSWIVYDDSQVAVIRVEIDPDALEWIYNYPQSDSMHQAQFHFQNAQLDTTVAVVGFRLRGNTSRDAFKKSFKISFNTFVDGGEFFDLEKLNLNGEHNDPTIARSKICWDWFNSIGLTAPRSSFAAVYINDDYYGLYLSVEHINDEFINKNYSDNSGNLWKCLWPADLTYRGENGSDYHPYNGENRPYELKTNVETYDYQPLARLISMINLTSNQNLADSLDRYLAVPEVLKYLATNVILGSWDDYWFLMNNYYLYHEPDRDIFHWIPYDYDNSMGIDWFGIEWAETDPYTFEIMSGGSRPLVDRLLSNVKYRNLYTHFLDHYNTNLFNPELWLDDLYVLRDTLAPWAEFDTYRHLDYNFDSGGGISEFLASYTEEGYSDQHVSHSLTDYVSLRYNSLPDMLNTLPAPPSIYGYEITPDHPVPGEEIQVIVTAWDESGLTFVQAQVISAEQGSQYYSMQFQPIADSPRVEDADRWVGTIPPLTESDTASLQFIAMDNSGNMAYFPPDPILIESLVSDDLGFRLNEFLARNVATNSDENSEFDDWVEIIGTNPEPQLLTGCYLTDRNDGTNLWQIIAPDMYLAEGDFLLIWCDNDEEQGDLHAGFRLDGDGEFLGLLAPDGVTYMDSLSFGPQSSDLTTGRFPDGTGNWQEILLPTPGAPNNSNFACEIGDLNCDTEINILDIVQLVSWILEGYDPDPHEFILADLNGDQNIDILDIVVLVEQILND